MDEGLSMCRWAYYGIEDEDMDGCQLSLGLETDPQAQLDKINAEIQKVVAYGLGDWRITQNDKWNRRTAAVLSVSKFSDVLRIVSEVYCKYRHEKDLTEDFVCNYCLNRFVTTQTHRAALLLFSKHRRVTMEAKERHPERDIWMDTKYPFDPKMTRPFKDLRDEPSLEKRRAKLEQLMANPKSYCARLYKEQSKEGRCRYQHRIFIINYNLYTNDSVAQRCEFNSLDRHINNWCDGFDIDKVHALKFSDIFPRKHIIYDPNIIIYSDIIWNVVM